MNYRESFLASLVPLREFVQTPGGAMADAIGQAEQRNPWFTREFILEALDAIVDEFLDPDKCRQWLHAYPERKGPAKRVALVMAGNIPLVGFHDLFSVIASGHQAVIKLSDKDPSLLPAIIRKWTSLWPPLEDAIQMTERLERMDAVIATGSNNSLRYFDYYFGSYPHIFRYNRNGVAVLTGEESPAALRSLGKDIFLFFGLGCRNVAKVYVPEGYDFSAWPEAIAPWESLAHHHKYKNNLDYNYALYLINQIPHLHLGHLILRQDDAVASRIGCLHYAYYSDQDALKRQLEARRAEIQCVVSVLPIEGWDHVLPGQSQHPALRQYADGTDTMEFLNRL